MTAGMNSKVRIWRLSNEDDDVVGGAVLSGTVQYTNIFARMDAVPSEQLLVQQGLETTKTFTATLVPGNLDIRERDELEITAPYDHVYLNNRFRIIEVRRQIFNARNPNNYMVVTMDRRIRAHGIQ
ncbi:unnamed protein product [marine sediment metagenome]|uniref:Head-tail adaptor protein n=1 Tax=marine sediment metagenome TaxID=412755 RepID=X0TAD3_9ZZZZ